MKVSLNAALLALTSILLIGGCTKSDIFSDESLTSYVSSEATAPDLSKCKIRRIFQKIDAETTVNALFSYNKDGNPYSVIY